MSGSDDELLTNDILSLLQQIETFEYEDPAEDQSRHSSSTISAEADQAESCQVTAGNDNEDFGSIASQETLENSYNQSTNENEDFGSIASQETLENSYNQSTNEGQELHDPDRDELLAILEDDGEPEMSLEDIDGEPEMSVEDMLEKIYDEKKEEEKKISQNPVLNKATSTNAEVPGLKTPILHPNVDTLIDLTDEQRVVTIKVEPAEKVILIDDDPCVKEENEHIGDKIVTMANKIQNKTPNLDTEISPSTTSPHGKKKALTKDEPIVIKDEPIVIKDEPIVIEDEPIVIEDDPPIKIEKPEIKKEHNTADCEIIKRERQSEPVASTSHGSVTNLDLNEKEAESEFNINEAEDGEVVDDDPAITVNNIINVKREPMSLIKPALGNVGVTAFGVNLQQALFASLLTDQISKMAKSIHKLKKSKHRGKKKSHKKKSKRKSNSHRSRKRSLSSSSSSGSRPRSPTHKQKSIEKSPLRKTYRPRQYQPRSPSMSPSRERHLLPLTRNYRTNKRSRSSSRSLSKSPERKQNYSKSITPRSNTRSPSLPKTKELIVKKNVGERSPSMSPPRRKRRYSSFSSSSTDSSSSSPSYKRRRRSVSRSKLRSRSRTPKRSQTVHLSKKVSSRSVSSTSIGNLPSTSQQTIVAQQTYQQEFRHGNSVMTRKATVTTSYEEELQSFKNSLVKTEPDSSNGYSDRNLCEVNKLEITVFDESGRDVTSKRPGGDLNHPFFIHPEDAELYRMKCQNGLQPLQALHEICVKCGWKFPNYLLLPTPKGFRFGMEIKGHRFVTERVAQQKKLAKAAAADVVLQWMKIVEVSPS